MAELPVIFIAGSQKSGTTYLCDLVDKHPLCIVSRPKEPHFFARPHDDRTLADYSRFFEAKAAVPGAIRIDGSSSYLNAGGSIERIRDALGTEARFVFVLRRPWERVISGYYHTQKKGHDRRPLEGALALAGDTADALIAAEADAIAAAERAGDIVPAVYRRRYQDWAWPFRYVGNSLYSRHLEPFEATFGAHNMLVLSFDRLLGDTQGTLRHVFEFMGVPPADIEVAAANRTNPTLVPPFPRLKQTIKRSPLLRGIGGSLARALPGARRARDYMMRGTRRSAIAATVPPNIMRALAEDVLLVDRTFGTDLASQWKVGAPSEPADGDPRAARDVR